MQYSGADDIPTYRSRFDRSPRRSVRRIYDLKTIDFANTPSGARRSATWSRIPSSRSGYGNGYIGSYGNSGYTTGYGSGYNNGYRGYGSGYNSGHDSGGASSNYSFGNHVNPSASTRNLGPDSHRRSWNRPFGSLLAEAEADLNTMSNARSRLFKMADDALSVLDAIREGFNSPFEPRSRQKWALDDLFGPTADDDFPPSRRYHSPIVMEDSKRPRPRWSTLVDDSDAELFGSDSSVNTLRRSPMPSTAEVLARLETPTDFPPFRCGGRLSADDRSYGRTDPTRTYYRSTDKPRDLDELRNARRHYFESQQNDETERNVPIIVDEQKPPENSPTVRIHAPAASAAPPPPPVNIPVVVESESRFTPTPITTPSTSSTQHKADDAKWSGRDSSFDSPEDNSSVITIDVSKEKCSIDVSKEKCSKLEEENSRLRDLIHNVTEINKRWETFSSEREAYINELKATIERQQEQFDQCLELLRLAKAGQVQSEDQRKDNFQHSPSYEHLKERLREIIEPRATEAELTQLQEEVARLQKRLDETKKEHCELVGAFHQVKRQSGEPEESSETSLLTDGNPLYRSLSRESNTQPDKFTTISTSSSTSTIHADQLSAAHRSITPLQDDDLDNQSVCSKFSDNQSICSKFSDNQSVCSKFSDYQSVCSKFSDKQSVCSKLSDAVSESKLSDRRNVPEREKDLFKYAFDSANLRNYQEDVYGKRHSSPADGLSPTPTPTPGATRYVPSDLYSSPTDGLSPDPTLTPGATRYVPSDLYSSPAGELSPTPTPIPSATRYVPMDVYSSPADGLSPAPTPTPGATRYVPLEVSCSGSSLASAAPIVSIPPSSRESSVDRDISICSDATIDCSPPSPIPVTVGYDNDGLATVTTFRTVPIGRERSPDRTSNGSDDSVKSVIETKPDTQRRPTSFIEEEETCSLVSPRGVLARTTSTNGSSVDGDGNGRTWSSDIFSRRLSADSVSCPKCGNTYPPSKYLQLMIHLDNCRTATGSPGVTLQELALSAINHLMNS